MNTSLPMAKPTAIPNINTTLRITTENLNSTYSVLDDLDRLIREYLLGEGNSPEALTDPSSNDSILSLAVTARDKSSSLLCKAHALVELINMHLSPKEMNVKN